MERAKGLTFFRRFNLTTSYEYPSVIFNQQIGKRANLEGLAFFLSPQQRVFEAQKRLGAPTFNPARTLDLSSFLIGSVSSTEQ